MNPARAARLRAAPLDPTEAALIDVEGTAKAAVLVPLDEREGELFAVFTRRRDDLRQHAGQISFPGGRVESADADLVDTALREASEEIGLPRDAVTVLGALDPISVRVSGFALYPFVGDVAAPISWTPAPREVEEVLELALTPLAGSYAERTIRRGDREVQTPSFTAGLDIIWGATAYVLRDLLARIGML